MGLYAPQQPDDVRRRRQPTADQPLGHQTAAQHVSSSWLRHDVGRLVDAADEATLRFCDPNSDSRRVFAVSGTAQVFLA